MEVKKRRIIKVVKNLDEADFLITEIRDLIEQVKGEEKKLNEKISDLRSRAQSKVDKVTKKVKQNVDKIFLYAEKNRRELTNKGKKKTVETPSGKFFWRLSSKVNLTDKEEMIVARLEAAGLGDLINITKKVNKDLVSARKNDVINIKGIEIELTERFSVTPSAVKLSKKQVELLLSKEILV